jgi:hypothetical protein
LWKNELYLVNFQKIALIYSKKAKAILLPFFTYA